MLKSVRVLVAFAVVFLAQASFASAHLIAVVSVAQQTLTVIVDGDPTYTWKVSTARPGYATPRGSFVAQWLDPDHLSSQYESAPMPHSVFFKDGYAIHGSFETKSLGHPVSHGCVRLSPRNAETFYNLVEAHGLEHTRIIVR